MRIRTAAAIVIALCLIGCGPPSERAQSEIPPATIEGVELTLTEFRAAVERHDLEAIMSFFAEDYSSREATGKSAVREWWTRVIDSGLADDLPFDLDTASLTVTGSTAEIIYFDERGELACHNLDTPCTTPQPYLDFRLEHDDQRGWLITGIPSEQR